MGLSHTASFWLGCVTLFLVADTQLYKSLCLSVGRSVGWSVTLELKSGKTRISAPAHPSATGGRVSGLVKNIMQMICESEAREKQKGIFGKLL